MKRIHEGLDRVLDRHRLVFWYDGGDEWADSFGSYATEGVSALAQANRARLRTAMAAGGLTVYSGEWWHFDGPGAGVERAILDVPVN